MIRRTHYSTVTYAGLLAALLILLVSVARSASLTPPFRSLADAVDGRVVKSEAPVPVSGGRFLKPRVTVLGKRAEASAGFENAVLHMPGGNPIFGVEKVARALDAPSDVDPKRRYAVIVAVKDYERGKGTPPLLVTPEDAFKLRNTLLRHGYLSSNVIVILDSPYLRLPDAKIAAKNADTLRFEIRDALSRARAAKAEYFVFAYYGYGANTGGENPRDILLPARFDFGVGGDFLQTEHLWAMLTGAGEENWEIPNLLVMLDVNRDATGDERFKMRLWTLPFRPRGKTVTLLCGSQPSEPSLSLLSPLEGNSTLNFQGGLFTEMFVRQIDAGKSNTWNDFHSHLDEEMAIASNEIARLGKRKSGDDDGQRPVLQSYPQQKAADQLWKFFERKPAGSSK